MYGTKSLSPKAQVTKRERNTALLIVAHGERGGKGDDWLVHLIANKMQKQSQYRFVKACFINKEPTLLDAFKEASPGPVDIFPLFMSDGYFVKQAIPEILDIENSSDNEVVQHTRILPPIGLNGNLPQIVTDLAIFTAEKSERSEEQYNLLLVAHGSKHDNASRCATLSLVNTLRRASVFTAVEAAFLEEAPFLEGRLGEIAGPLIVVGLFIGEGLHAGVDLPEAVKASGRQDIILSMPLTRWHKFTDIICSELNKSAA